MTEYTSMSTGSAMFLEAAFWGYSGSHSPYGFLDTWNEEISNVQILDKTKLAVPTQFFASQNANQTSNCGDFSLNLRRLWNVNVSSF